MAFTRQLVADDLDSTRWIEDLIEQGGQLFGSTYARQTSHPNGGKLLRFTGNAWVQVANPVSGANRIEDMALFDYGSGEKIMGGGGAQGTSIPFNDRACLQEYDVSTAQWIIKARAYPLGLYLDCMALFAEGSKIWGGLRQGATLVSWEGTGTDWVLEVSPSTGHQYDSVLAIVRYNGNIYCTTGAGGSDPGGCLVTPNGANWQRTLEPPSGISSLDDAIVFDNKIYAVGVGSTLKLWYWDGVATTWQEAAEYVGTQAGRQLLVIDGSIYVVAEGGIFKYDGVSTLEVIILRDNALEDITAAAFFNNELYFATGDSRPEPITDSWGGKLFKVDIGLIPDPVDPPFLGLAPQLKYDTVDYFGMISKLLPRGFPWIVKLFALSDLIQDFTNTTPTHPTELQDEIGAGEIQDVIAPSGAGSTWFANLLSCFASEFYRFEQQVVSLIREAVPGLSVEVGLLTRWEKVAGLPDKCTLNLGGTLTEAERQAAVHSKLINESQTTTKTFLIDYAANFGFEITVTERNTTTDSFIMGVSIMGVGIMGGAGENTVIEITVVSGSGNLPLLQCIFRRIVPAHVVLVWIT